MREPSIPFVPSAVEGRAAPRSTGASTSLGTNGDAAAPTTLGLASRAAAPPVPFVPSAVEGLGRGRSISLGTNGGEEVAFATAAARLAGQAGAALGWSPDAFWQATPAELAAVVAALTGGERAGPPDAATIARMMRENPDG